MPSEQLLYKDIADIFGNPEEDFFMSLRGELIEVMERIGKMCIIYIDSEGPFEVSVDNAMAIFGERARLLQHILDTPKIGDTIPIQDGNIIQVVNYDGELLTLQLNEDPSHILQTNVTTFRNIVKSALGISND